MDILVLLAGIELGPYSDEQARRYMAEGLLLPSDPAKTDGMQDWVAVSTILDSLPSQSPAPELEEALAGSSTGAGWDTGLLLEAPQMPVAAPAEEATYEPPAPDETQEIDISPPAEEFAPPTEEIPVAEEAVLVAEELPAAEESVPVAEEVLPPADDVSVAEEWSPTASPQVVPPAEPAPAPEDDASAAGVTRSVRPRTPRKLSQGPRKTEKVTFHDMIRPQARNTGPIARPPPIPIAPAPPLDSAPPAAPTPEAPFYSAPTRAIAKPKKQTPAASPPTLKAFSRSSPPVIPAEPPPPAPDPNLTAHSVPEPAPPAPRAPVARVAPPLPEPAVPISTPRPTVTRIAQAAPAVSAVPAPVAARKPPPLPASFPAFEPSLGDGSPTLTVAERAEFMPRRSWLAHVPWAIVILGVLGGLLLAVYAWLPYQAADSLLKGLEDGSPEQLERTIDFPSVRASLHDEVKAQIEKAAMQNDNSSAQPNTEAVLAMIDNSIDRYVTSDGIATLMNRSGNSAESDQDSTISPNAARDILRQFDSERINTRKFASPDDFVIDGDTASLHLQLYGSGWKLYRIEIKSAFPISAFSFSPASAPATGSPSLSAPVINTYLAEGKEDYDKGHWDAAIEDFTKVLAINPRASVAFSNRGAARQAQGDLEGAIADYSQAIEIDPKLIPAFFGRGNAKMARNDLDGAIADYTQAVDLNPKFFDAFFMRGDVKTMKDDWDGAIADYTEAISLDPSQAGPYNNRGYARQAKNDLDGAIADYTQALSINPKLAGAYYNRGLAEGAESHFDAAITDFDQSINLDPQRPGAYYNRGNAKNSKHDFDGAIADYTQALTLDPKIALGYCNRGLARQAKGDLDGAFNDYSQALAIDPKIAVAYYNRGLIKQQRNDLDGAIADSSHAIDLNSKNVQAYYNRGLAKLTKGNLDGAMADLHQFCQDAPRDRYADNARLYLWLIDKARNAKGDPDQDLSNALENNWNTSPDDLPSKIAEFLLGQIGEDDLLAAAASSDGPKDQGQHCEAWYFAGMKRLLDGDKPGAIEAFHKCLATGKNDYCEFLLAEAELQALEPGNKK
jgi:tetratricopeptide (TPR) repeat protein